MYISKTGPENAVFPQMLCLEIPQIWYIFDGTFVVPKNPSLQNILWEMISFRSILEFIVELATESGFHSVVEDLPCVRHWTRALLLSQ